MAAGMDGVLFERIREAPVSPPGSRPVAELEALRAEAQREPALTALARVLEDARTAELLAGTMAGSPYLKGLMGRDLARLERLLVTAP